MKLEVGGNRQSLTATRFCSALFAIAAVVNIGSAHAEVRQPDHVVPMWYLGMPIVSRSFEYSERGFMSLDQIPDDLPYRTTLSYFVGVADGTIGAAPAQRIPIPGQPKASMPGHQTVLSCIGSQERPILGIAYFVVPGPNANKHNLRTDPMPEGSVVGAPLPTAMRIGPSWLPLTSHVVIEQGLAEGVLRLKFFGANPVTWGTASWARGYPLGRESDYPPCIERKGAPPQYLARISHQAVWRTGK